MNLLDTALSYAARGWHVFPCKPSSKEPATPHGHKDATLDEAQIRAWWTKSPDANVAIATGPSGLTVLDCDHGIADEAALQAFCRERGLPETYAVRTGRRPEFGVQLYFAGEGVRSIPWDDGPASGDIRGATGYVMAAGSVHPSGEAYAVIADAPIAPVPNYVRALRAAPKTLPGGGTNPAVEDDGGPITEHRNVHMISLLGRRRGEGADDDQIREYAIQVNEERMTPPLDEEELERLITNACKFPVPEAAPEVTLGGKLAKPSIPDEPVDWRTRYLTFEKIRDAKPTEFLIQGFLALGSITALAAPVAQRKSLIAMNVAHALCTGEPLFDYFEVVRKPERVVYLCPEMGLASFSTRLKQIGLAECVGDTLFCQTMDEDRVSLADLDEELPGAVVIIDTLTRFVDGDQNSSEAMSKFADVIFGLKRKGATVLLLHHSVKGAAGGLTLDSAMRGSTELAAFVTCCWATRLKDPDDPYHSPSLLVNVKQRDFESKPFEVVGDETCRMHIVGEPGSVATLKTKSDAAALAMVAQIVRDNPGLGIGKVRAKLSEAGVKKGTQWVSAAVAEALKTGVRMSE
jgi:hypothetical protein